MKGPFGHEIPFGLRLFLEYNSSIIRTSCTTYIVLSQNPAVSEKWKTYLFTRLNDGKPYTCAGMDFQQKRAGKAEPIFEMFRIAVQTIQYYVDVLISLVIYNTGTFVLLALYTEILSFFLMFE